MSLNRFERKKNIALALEAFGLVLERLGSKAVAKKLRLVIAGRASPSRKGEGGRPFSANFFW